MLLQCFHCEKYEVVVKEGDGSVPVITCDILYHSFSFTKFILLRIFGRFELITYICQEPGQDPDLNLLHLFVKIL